MLDVTSYLSAVKDIFTILCHDKLCYLPLVSEDNDFMTRLSRAIQRLFYVCINIILIVPYVINDIAINESLYIKLNSNYL